MLSLRTATLVALTTLLLTPAGGTAQAALPLKHAGGATQTAITEADLMTRIYIFADDSVKGRRAGSEGGLKGTTYIEREVRRLGLVPAGDNGTFFQAVPLYTRTVDPAGSIMLDSVRLVPGQDFFPLHPGGKLRSLNGAEVVFAGSTSDTSTLLPAARTAGKAVVVSGPTGGIARRYPDAVAFIVVPTGGGISQNLRNFVANPSTLMRSDDDTVSRAITIAVAAADMPKFLGVPVENARPGTVGRTIRGEIGYVVQDAPARNVVAILPGSDQALRNQYVALGAHSDHIGTRRQGPLDHDSVRTFNELAKRIYVARTGSLPNFPGAGLTAEERASIRVNLDSLRALRPARLDSVFNGADDDASGSMGLLEVAEKFAGARTKPKRSLIFVWHTGEEFGLFGAEHFTDFPTVPRDSIVAQINLDMIGRGSAQDIPSGKPGYLQLLGSRRLSTELGDLVEAVNTSGRHNMTFDYQYDANGHPEQFYCRSDHYAYARYGIPIVFMSTGGHVDYHQLTDEPQYINYPQLLRVSNFVADVAQRVADLDHRVALDKPKPDPKAPCRQ